MTVTPYHPMGLELDGYHKPVTEVVVVVAIFFAGCFVVTALAWLAARRLPRTEQLMFIWLINSGLIHLVVEGTFSLCDKFFQNDDPNMILLELWKEYSNADSRYATRDSFIVAVETCTAFILGPFCLLGAVGLLTKAPWRWALVLAVSLAQFYGDVLYFATCWLDDGKHVRPGLFYFWFLFVFMNGLWIVIPGLCIAHTLRKSIAAVAKVEGMSSVKKRM
jgi:cholestenol Delta-isomerase